MYQISPLSNLIDYEIDYGATGEKAIVQRAAFLLTSIKNTYFMDRNFGRESAADELIEPAKIRMTVEIIELFEQNIPEAIVEEVNFDENEILEGKLIPIVKVVMNDG